MRRPLITTPLLTSKMTLSGPRNLKKFHPSKWRNGHSGGLSEQPSAIAGRLIFTRILAISTRKTTSTSWTKRSFPLWKLSLEVTIFSFSKMVQGPISQRKPVHSWRKTRFPTSHPKSGLPTLLTWTPSRTCGELSRIVWMNEVGELKMATKKRFAKSGPKSNWASSAN